MFLIYLETFLSYNTMKHECIFKTATLEIKYLSFFPCFYCC